MSSAEGSLRSFKHRNFRLFFTANFVSNVGTWAQRIAQDWLVVTDLHRGGSELGISLGPPYALGVLPVDVVSDDQARLRARRTSSIPDPTLARAPVCAARLPERLLRCRTRPATLPGEYRRADKPRRGRSTRVGHATAPVRATQQGCVPSPICVMMSRSTARLR